ncbi:MAG: alpha-amylase [Candidatus Bathyarchaeia archaeon]
MPDVCLIFEVHQPFRLDRNFHANLLAYNKIGKETLFDLYFDSKINKAVFNRIAEECYLPANEIVLKNIDQCKKEKKKFKVAYSISGVFVEQCERWNKDVLDFFKQLAESECVEFLDQTYYHSLASLFSNGSFEFVEQIRMHQQLMEDLFNYKPIIFENTECLYNNRIAKIAANLNYEAIVTEGSERILGWRSPNYVYEATGSKIRVLLRNYRLSDDIGFRFNSRDWNQWPLTADKYAAWLASTQGHVINIFMDYETFGEHYRRESGIHEFLRWLPIEVLKWSNLSFCTPSEVVRRHAPVGEISVSEYETVSWADVERDTSAWLGNSLQKMSFSLLEELEPIAKDVNDDFLLKIWRHLQTSDHLYYMSTKSGGSGDVHSSFNPYGNPLEAFITYIQVISDLQVRFNLELEKSEYRNKRILRRLPKEKGFIFFHDFARPTSHVAYSLRDFYSILKTIDKNSIKFHMNRGDFERWISQVIGDDELAGKIFLLSRHKIDEEILREKLLNIIGNRIKEMESS